MSLEKTKGYQKVLAWLKKDDKKPFKFQEEAWSYYAKGYSGLVNAPTGFGKTFSLFLAAVIEGINLAEKRIKRKRRIDYNSSGLHRYVRWLKILQEQ